MKSIVRLVSPVRPPSTENACSQRDAAGEGTGEGTVHTNRTRTSSPSCRSSPPTFRVDRILELTVSEKEFTRPDGFGLAAYRTAYQRGCHERPHRGEALVRPAPGAVLPRAVPAGPEEAGGRRLFTVPIESADHAHGEFLRLGADVEVLRPAELRAKMARTIAELAERYGNAARSDGD
ncbi:helix-turn-helix transcriptional regulator [Streptomyces sp. NPDC020490]|uniref:helix-turn-helix transcriptional regulator n=1 Tax=Streptomyces sp. NPDC020490 TaxID=3365078 RepID=UPI0037A62078